MLLRRTKKARRLAAYRTVTQANADAALPRVDQAAAEPFGSTPARWGLPPRFSRMLDVKRDEYSGAEGMRASRLTGMMTAGVCSQDL